MTFSREVVRIFDRKCLPCHTRGGVAMSLATYREARPWARAIREELVEQRMPPWPAAPGYGEFANDIGLTARELTTILTWTDGGVPRGDDRDLPPRPAAPAVSSGNAPDRRLELPAQQVPALEEHVVRRVTVDTGLTAGQRVREVSIVPGNRRVLRAAFVSIAAPDGRSPGQWLGAWTPWRPGVSPPDGAGFLLPAGARLLVELHYRGRDDAAEDRSSVALFFAPSGETYAAGQLLVDVEQAPPSRRHARGRGTSTVEHDTAVWAVLPPSAAGSEPQRTASLEVTAHRPDGSIDVLLWLPEGRYDWPTPYVFRSPVLLPAGTRVTVTRAVRSDGSGRQVVPQAPVLLATYRPPASIRPSGTRQPR